MAATNPTTIRFADTFGETTPIVIAADDQLQFGTFVCGDAYGQASNFSVKRTADKEEIMNTKGGLRAVILKNPTFQLSMEVLMDKDKPVPGLGSDIEFPNVAGLQVTGKVLECEVKGESGGVWKASITATSWDAMQNGNWQTYTTEDNGTLSGYTPPAEEGGNAPT